MEIHRQAGRRTLAAVSGHDSHANLDAEDNRPFAKLQTGLTIMPRADERNAWGEFDG